ncbi:hypothetical protein JFT92_25525 [Pseudomonas sp. TH35]|nr:hypothetical protein [Pseudomonas sp. TH71]MBK5372538.1 hypothetical protein [Pseudomonas sp. TH40]MBK5383707.1 hypothetical protein [Pseudomonas sp. TH35]MBK5389166.1 hypothetical protein [Pseudomonas sp. TH38]MBK5406461.1 hypothetical protein [Pseudomonas sp. TH37]MBK5468559.1 hypothetical protein [Pseudomonas sp. TH20]MBK5524838.1 hypothetical protein [Pseudomonas sp. TH09]
MAYDPILQGGISDNDPVRPIPDRDDPSMDHDAPPGMDPSRDPADTDVDRPEDWRDPDLDDDIPAPDEKTPLSDDRR